MGAAWVARADAVSLLTGALGFGLSYGYARRRKRRQRAERGQP